MEDSKILDLLRKKSPQTTLEIAKGMKLSWHVVQEQLLEMQIDGKVDRIKVGGQNLWYLKGMKPTLMGSLGFSMITAGIAGIVLVLFAAAMINSGMFSGTPTGLAADSDMSIALPASPEIDQGVQNFLFETFGNEANKT